MLVNFHLRECLFFFIEFWKAQAYHAYRGYRLVNPFGEAAISFFILNIILLVASLDFIDEERGS